MKDEHTHTEHDAGRFDRSAHGEDRDIDYDDLPATKGVDSPYPCLSCGKIGPHAKDCKLDAVINDV